MPLKQVEPRWRFEWTSRNRNTHLTQPFRREREREWITNIKPLLVWRHLGGFFSSLRLLNILSDVSPYFHTVRQTVWLVVSFWLFFVSSYLLFYFLLTIFYFSSIQLFLLLFSLSVFFSVCRVALLRFLISSSLWFSFPFFPYRIHWSFTAQTVHSTSKVNKAQP